MTKLHLIDGTFELFRCYFGAPKALNDDGLEVGAVRGLLRTLRSLLQQDDCTHVAVAFDRVIESFRNNLFGGYKTGAGIEPSLLAQFPLAEEATRSLGIVTWPMVEFEADDAMAAAAHKFKDQFDQIVLASPDKDLAQCVDGQRVVLLDRIRDRLTDEERVLERFGVPPVAIPDYLALVGDKADGIPGIARWGARSTSVVLQRFGHLQAIPSDPDEWDVTVRGKATLAKNLNAERGAANLYKVLATLRTDVPLEESKEDLRWNGANERRLRAFCDRISDERFLQRAIQLDPSLT